MDEKIIIFCDEMYLQIKLAVFIDGLVQSLTSSILVTYNRLQLA